MLDTFIVVFGLSSHFQQVPTTLVRSQSEVRVPQLLRSAQEELPLSGQSAPRFDFSQQASGSGQSVVQSDLSSQQGVIDVESQSVVLSLPSVEKPISPNSPTFV